MESESKSNFEYYAADEDYVLIPDGEYYAECIEYKEQEYFITGQVKKRKLYLCFHITMDCYSYESLSEKIWMPFNAKLNGKYGKRSKYRQAWVQVWGRQPSRKALMSPKIFLNRLYRIKTKTVKRYYTGELRPENEWYSIVDIILESGQKTYPDSEYPL